MTKGERRLDPAELDTALVGLLEAVEWDRELARACLADSRSLDRVKGLAAVRSAAADAVDPSPSFQGEVMAALERAGMNSSHVSGRSVAAGIPEWLGVGTVGVLATVATLAGLVATGAGRDGSLLLPGLVALLVGGWAVVRELKMIRSDGEVRVT